MQAKYMMMITLIVSATLMAGCASSGDSNMTNSTPTPSVPPVTATTSATVMPAAPQDLRTVTGTVTIDGKPASNYYVGFWDVPGRMEYYRPQTDANGSFSLTFPPDEVSPFPFNDGYYITVKKPVGEQPIYTDASRRPFVDGQTITIDLTAQG